MSAIGAVQEVIGSVPQQRVRTEHVLHAGMYARTVRLRTDLAGVGVLVTIPTLLIVHGDVDLLTDAGWVEVRGYGVLRGDAGRKQVFVTRSAVEMTMVFATAAQSIDKAEREFTDEFEQLMSRKAEEMVCQE